MPPRRCASSLRSVPGPGAKRPAPPRRAAAVVASHIDAVLDALEIVFDDLDAGGCRQEVDGSALVEADGWALEPLLCRGARAEHRCRFRKYLGKLPCPAALLPIEQLGGISLAPLEGAQADADRL